MTYELSISKFSPWRLHPFINSIQRLKADLATGTSYFPTQKHCNLRNAHYGTVHTSVSITSYPAHDDSLYAGRVAYEAPAREFASGLIAAFTVLHGVLDGRIESKIKEALSELDEKRRKFSEAMDVQLNRAIHDWEVKSKEHGGLGLDKNLLQVSLFCHKMLGVRLPFFQRLGGSDKCLSSTDMTSAHVLTCYIPLGCRDLAGFLDYRPRSCGEHFKEEPFSPTSFRQELARRLEHRLPVGRIRG